MIKVCHMTSAHKSTDVRIFHKQCTSLVKAGYDVYLVAQGESYDSNGVKIIGVSQISGSRFKRMTQGAKSVYKKAIEIDADIYQIHDPELLPYALKLKKKGKKVIFDSHEDYFTQIQEKQYLVGFLRIIIAHAYKYYEKRICKKIDAVIFPCTMNGKNVFEGRAKKVVFINNTPILTELYANYTLDYPKKNKAICHIGGLTYSRGITHLIKATYKADAKLILGGLFNPQNYAEELTALKEYECVDYRGFVDRSGVCEILKESNIGVSTLLNIGQYNKADNFATKVYEYMAMGLPIIISDYPYAREVNKKYNCFMIVEPTNIDKIANAINYLIDNTETAKEMGQNGRRAVLEEFNWGVEEKKLYELYESLGVKHE